jgi:putative ribosome biogenesis GTPase RsgA
MGLRHNIEASGASIRSREVASAQRSGVRHGKEALYPLDLGNSLLGVHPVPISDISGNRQTGRHTLNGVRAIRLNQAKLVYLKGWTKLLPQK